jgi:hypothetical protein
VSTGGDVTLTGVLDDLARRGYTEDFEVAGDSLVSVESGRALKPDDLVIREFRRFEGVSDPDDMSIVYAIEARDGTRGTLVDAFGVYSDPAVSRLLERVPIRRPA